MMEAGMSAAVALRVTPSRFLNRGKCAALRSFACNDLSGTRRWPMRGRIYRALWPRPLRLLDGLDGPRSCKNEQLQAEQDGERAIANRKGHQKEMLTVLKAAGKVERRNFNSVSGFTQAVGFRHNCFFS